MWRKYSQLLNGKYAMQNRTGKSVREKVWLNLRSGYSAFNCWGIVCDSTEYQVRKKSSKALSVSFGIGIDTIPLLCSRVIREVMRVLYEKE
jgi:hypothetical protein